MKNLLTLSAFAAVLVLSTNFAEAAARVAPDISLESQQNIEHYMAGAQVFGITSVATCGTPCAMSCPCMPTCCPANLGLLDGGHINPCAVPMTCPTSPCGA